MSDQAATGQLTTAAARVRGGALLRTIIPRLVAACVSGGALAILLIAASVQPDPEGHGTHTQLGLAACGWAVVANSPCPTCGMTTSFAHAVRGELAAAFHCQPMGFLLAIATAVAFWAGLHITLTGSTIWRVYARLLTPRALWIVAGLAIVAWIYKWATWGSG